MEKKEEENVLEEGAPGSSAADSEIESSIPSVVPDLREGSESAHLREPPARGPSETGSSMESSLADTAESVQKPGTSKDSVTSKPEKSGISVGSVQKSGTSKESMTSKTEKSGLSVESSVIGTKSEVSESAKGTEKSKSPGHPEVSVEIPTEEEGIVKPEEAEKEEEVDFDAERRSAQRYMVFKCVGSKSWVRNEYFKGVCTNANDC